MSDETLFHEALAKPPAERPAFLDQACASQPELRAAVEALLAAHGASAKLLDQLPPDPNATEPYTPGPDVAGVAAPEGTGTYVRTTGDDGQAPPRRVGEIGTVIAGRYTLVGTIGEGGMGSVFRAEQSEPVKRQVALKLIKSGMDSQAVLRRFEAERQALALMDHPNIARVYDGGTTPSGQPF